MSWAHRCAAGSVCVRAPCQSQDLAPLTQSVVFRAWQDGSELNEIIGNYSVLSDHYRRLAVALDVTEAKTPEEVYKSHLAETGSTSRSSNRAPVESARQNAASTYVRPARRRWSSTDRTPARVRGGLA